MKGSIYFSCLIVVLFLLLLGPTFLYEGSNAITDPLGPQAFEATAVWGSTQSPLVAAPSSTNLPLFITLYDLGPTTPIYAVTVSFSPVSPLIPVSGEPQTISQYVPEVTAGQSVVLIGYYDVSSSATPGIYNQSLSVNYSNGTALSYQNVTFSIAILGSSNIAVSGFTYNPALIYPGMTLASLEVYIQNTGSSIASNVSTNLITSYPVSPASKGSTLSFLGFLPVGSPVPVTFLLSIANSSVPENSSLTLIVNYNGGLSQQFVIPFVEQPRAIIQLKSIGIPTMNIGDSADYVTMQVENIGTVPAQFTMLTMLPSNIFSPSIPSSENPLLALTAMNQSVGTIMPGQVVNVTYVIQVSSSIPQGTYSLGFLVTWAQSSSLTPFAQESSIAIPVHRTLVQSISSEISNPIILLAIIVAVVVIAVAAVIGLRASRRRRKSSLLNSNKIEAQKEPIAR
jgi:hypothetical protein